jgi:hypothetical protein
MSPEWCKVVHTPIPRCLPHQRRRPLPSR